MATSQASQNRVYLFRLQMLIIDGGTIVIRNLFDQKHSGVPLGVLLAQEQSTISRLKMQKNITQKQYDLLYPQGNPPSTKYFDITLLVCLMRNLKIFGLNKKYAWNSVPQKNDTSTEADISRLKEFRNEVLLRLNTSVCIPVPDLQQTMDGFKTCTLDPEEEERIEKEIKAWQEMEKNLENQLQLVSKDVQGVKKEVQALKKTTQEVNKNYQLVKKDVQMIQENVQEHKQRTSEHAELLTDTKNRVIELEQQTTKRNPLKACVAATETVYEKRKQELKNELIVFNNNHHSSIPLSPLFEDNDTSITDFYITPDMHSMQVENFSLDENEIKNILSLEDIFYRGDKRCTEIYITAEAGFGKTAFSKWLAVNWCQAHREDDCKTQYFSDKDIEALRKFEFLFLVSLREACQDCSIDDMIQNQILIELARPSIYTTEILEEVLSNERCLVILDGLDEWSHPESAACKKMKKLVPHRNARENCTILTTTRPWKLNVLGLRRSEIHRKIEIIGLSEESVEKLKRKVIAKVKRKREIEVKDEICSLNKQIREREITHFQKVPLLLMYLICLWCDGFPLGRSKCEFFCHIIELLLQRTINKYKEQIGTMQTDLQSVPSCFKANECCKRFYRLLQILGRLSFQTLFRKTNKNTLVFDSSEAEIYLDVKDLNFCLLAGLLTQNKVDVKLTCRKTKISFAHKTIQEFLAALYMYSESNRTDMLNHVRSKCDSVKAILEMSNVFVFLNGFSLDTQTSKQLSEILMKVVAMDDVTQTYRTTSRLHNYRQSVQPLKDIQDMFIACHDENVETVEEISNLHFQDVFIDGDCKYGKYPSYLQKLIAVNKEHISTLSIEIEGLPSLNKISKQFRLDEICGVDKVWYRGECCEADIIRLLTGSVHSLKAFSLTSCEWKGDGFIPRRDSWSHEMCETIQGMQNLDAVNIDNFQISHGQLDELMSYLAVRTSMKEIKLSNILCLDGDQCGGHSLDMSLHSNLTMLSLCNISLSKLELNVSMLEHCKVGPLCKPAFASACLHFLPSASKLHTFWCSYLVSAGDIKTMLDILPLLTNVKDVRLRNIDLGEKSLTISHKMVNINYIRLLSVKMSSTSLHGLVKAAEECTHQVTIDLRGCIVTPEEEFKKVRQYILTSDCFDVLFDNINQFNDYAFEFKTTTAKEAIQQQ
ncbi:uncharacterized protein LOC123555156 isoform X2 [Mercenaria mercenaria]|uniref:uncharacterized protein LOC123555156 isoform X2 n=1 Tax=Mercenaria mercenaria TaxID=6596 RepID=UPI00234F1D3E|nr:uncharacterized protein LOC123555156 isoform X2 [Mercenaria mercenaria]